MLCYPTGFLAPFLNFVTAAEIHIVSEEIGIEIFLQGRDGRLCFVIALIMEKIFCPMLSIFSVLLQGWDAIEWIIQNSESALS